MEDAAADSTAGLPPSLTQDRHLPPRSRGKTQRRRTLNQRVRQIAKQYHAEHGVDVPCRTHGLKCYYDRDPSQENSSELRQHARNHFAQALQEPKGPYAWPPWAGGYVRDSRPRSTWTTERDGVALARSRVPLPSDRDRTLQRHPSLERQDAFCDATTYKGRVHVKNMANIAADDDAQVADLYRMGLLYDEDESRQRADAAFNLNDIHHEQPVYSIRPARRGRKLNKTPDYAGPLPLDLSFADLGNDCDLAQYLVSPSEEAASDECVQHESRRTSQSTAAPLRVIYELATSRPSFDVDTSQPPDLMTDSLSDYDCFSDSELDDDHGVPSQQEVHDAAATTSASGPWVLLGDDS